MSKKKSKAQTNAEWLEEVNAKSQSSRAPKKLADMMKDYPPAAPTPAPAKMAPEATKNLATAGRCYTTHPPLQIGEKLIYGGSCSYPIVEDADIYIGFDMSMRQTKNKYPWNDAVTGPVEVLFYIPDMGIPSSAVEFKKMIEWVAVQLIANKKVHAGCIGGHGRTGTFLAALVAHMTGNKDAVQYVRDNYCQKAVESEKQMEFLHTEYGVNKIKPTKQAFDYGAWKDDAKDAAHQKWSRAPAPAPATRHKSTASKAGDVGICRPMVHSPYRVWGSNVDLTNAKL